ncbi:MAG: flagellar biosynthesis anti-sigma factor FlgM [Angelakisella sp.]
MKIDLNGAYRAYAKNSTTLTQQSDRMPGKEERLPSGNLDRVSISSEAAQRSEFDRMVHSAAAEVEAGTPASRLGELKQAVQSGQYHVPTEKLAEAILNAYV